MASQTAAREVTVEEVAQDLSALLDAVARAGEEVLIREGDEPRAAVIPYALYREWAAERDRTRRLAAVERLEALAKRVRTRNEDLSEEQANALAQEIRDEAIANLIERDGIRFVDEPDA